MINYIKIIVFTSVLAVIILTVYYIKSLQRENEILTSKNEVLSLQLDEKTKDYEYIINKSKIIQNENLELIKEHETLNAKLNKLDRVIDKGSEKHSKMISDILTNGVIKLNEDFTKITNN